MLYPHQNVVVLLGRPDSRIFLACRGTASIATDPRADESTRPIPRRAGACLRLAGARFFAGLEEDRSPRCAFFAAATAFGLPGLGGGVSVKSTLRERRRWASSASSLATATLALPGALRFRPFTRSRSDFMRGLFFTAPLTASSSIHPRNLFECGPVCLPGSLSADSLSSGRTPA